MMMMEDPVEGQFLGLDLAQVVGIVPNDNDGYNFGFGLVFEDQVTFSDEVIIPNAEGEQGAVALNQLQTVESEATAGRDAIQEALNTQVLKQAGDKSTADAERVKLAEDFATADDAAAEDYNTKFDIATAGRNDIESELDLQKEKQESERAAMDTAYKAADEAAAEDYNAKFGIASEGRDAIQEALNTQVIKQESDKVASNDRLDIIEGGEDVVGSIDYHIKNVIDGSPAALDTLKELSDALGQDADFAGSITTLVGEHATSDAAARVKLAEDFAAADDAAAEDYNAKFGIASDGRDAIQEALNTQVLKQAGDKSTADAERVKIAEEYVAADEAAAEDYNAKFDIATAGRNDIESELDLQKEKQESERAAMDTAYKAADADAAEDYNAKFDIATAGRNDIESELDLQKEKQESERAAMDTAYKAADADAADDRELIRGEFAEADEALQSTIDEMNETLSTQISEIENEGVQDSDFTKQTVDVGGKAAGEKGQMVIPGKITDSMVVTFVGGLFQHGATCEYDSELDSTTISVVLYADQPEYSPMTAFGVKSFGTE
jgi:hypothetical protein